MPLRTAFSGRFFRCGTPLNNPIHDFPSRYERLPLEVLSDLRGICCLIENGYLLVLEHDLRRFVGDFYHHLGKSPHADGFSATKYEHVIRGCHLFEITKGIVVGSCNIRRM